MRLTGGITTTKVDVDPFERQTTTKIGRYNVEPGTELTVQSIGRCRFVALVTNPRNGRQWLDVVDKRNRVRSCNLDTVKTVHIVKKTRENAA